MYINKDYDLRYVHSNMALKNMGIVITNHGIMKYNYYSMLACRVTLLQMIHTCVWANVNND